MNIGIVGCGSLGGVITFRLATVPEYRVWTINRNPEIKRAISEYGLILKVGRKRGCLRPELVDNPLEIPVPLDCVILTMKSNTLLKTAQSMLPLLAPRALMITIQNGLIGLELADRTGFECVLPASVLWGASMDAPGEYTVTAPGPFIIGETNGAQTPRLDQAREILGHVFPVIVSQNIEGVHWAKLAINASLTSLGAITGFSFGKLVKNRKLRELIIAIGRECMHVSEKLGITLEPLGGGLRVDNLLKDSGMSAWTKHLLIRILGFKHRRTTSAILASIERGRETEIDYLNGKIADLGKELGVTTPLNERVVQIIRKLESGILKPDPQNLHLLY